ncbi:MAG: hypothetical protein C0404_07550 [Verrucomicrobia bacterium]|nr:hypothetical protein [Verrucomicrobiota bacterium]
MGTDWRGHRKTVRRPRKTESEKKRRLKVQKRRLVVLGMSEASVEKLNQRQVKDLLKYPLRTVRQVKANAAKAK